MLHDIKPCFLLSKSVKGGGVVGGIEQTFQRHGYQAAFIDVRGILTYFCWSCVVAESLNSVITYFDAVLLPVQQSGSRHGVFLLFFFF